MVARIRLRVVWREEIYDMTIAMAPLLVASTSAASIYNALYLHPLNARLWRGINFLLQHAAFSSAVPRSTELFLGRPAFKNSALCSVHFKDGLDPETTFVVTVPV